MKDKIILVDCDGVILDWEPAFTRWMMNIGYQRNRDSDGEYKIHKRFKVGRDIRTLDLVTEFNESPAIGTLKPLRDAVEYIRRLHFEHGYKFHCITSLSTHPVSQAYRQKNLDEVFGAGIFERLVCLPTGSDKDNVLAEYRDSGCYWLEDKYDNAVAGVNAGLQSLLMKHSYNEFFNHPKIRMVENWQHVYNIVVNS